MPSISKMRGCFAVLGPPVVIIVGIVLVIGMLNMGGVSIFGGGDAAQSADLGSVVFKVNGEPTYQSEITMLENNMRAKAAQSMQQSGQQMSASDELGYKVGAVDLCVRNGLLRTLAAENAIKATEDEVPDWVKKKQIEEIERNEQMFKGLYDSQLEQATAAFEKAKKDKGVSSKEAKDAQERLDNLKKVTFDQFFSQYMGGTKAQLLEQINAAAEEISKSSTSLRLGVGDVLLERVMDHYKSKADTSDETLKKSYDKITYKKLLISSEKNSDAESKANEVLQKIRVGMKFDEAFKQFSDLKAEKDQKPEEVGVTTLERLMLSQMTELEPVAKAKPNEITEVIVGADGASIYWIQKIVPEVPKDFDKVKTTRAEEIKVQYAQKALIESINESRKNAKIEWNRSIYQALYEYREVRFGDKVKDLGGASNRDKRIALYREVMKIATAADKEDPQSAALIKYMLINQIDADTPKGPNKDKLAVEKFELFNMIKSDIPYQEFRFEYIDAALAVKNGDKALEEIRTFAVGLTDATPDQKATYDKIVSKLAQASNYASKDSKLIAEINKELERWRSIEAEAKKREVEAAKAQKAEEEKQKAEAAKKKESPPAETPKKSGN